MQDEILGRLTPLQRRCFAAIQTKGELGAPGLRVDIELPDGQVWKARPDGCTDEITALREVGLIYVHHKEKRGGPRTKIFAVTPPDRIEAEALKFKKESRPQRDTSFGASTRQIADYRRQEKAAGTSAQAIWIRYRRRIVEVSQVLRRVKPLLFWKAVSNEELGMVYDEVADMVSWGQQVLASVPMERADRELREKIAQIRQTNGRELEEGATARRLANKLEAQLLG